MTRLTAVSTTLALFQLQLNAHMLEMLLQDVLNLCPSFMTFGFGELPDPFDDPTSDPDVKSAALFVT